MSIMAVFFLFLFLNPGSIQGSCIAFGCHVFLIFFRCVSLLTPLFFIFHNVDSLEGLSQLSYRTFSTVGLVNCFFKSTFTLNIFGKSAASLVHHCISSEGTYMSICPIAGVAKLNHLTLPTVCVTDRSLSIVDGFFL